ncbi:hypothetical protein SDC9_88282 [bioreactor metagenome]|uniref:Uncharacterized protein n=1 Tax=bioreactor metagenome TaxID=1076179 RepID=A0A644ZLN7_9ZZZZ
MTPQDGRAFDGHGVKPLENAALYIHKQPVSGVGYAAGNGHQQNSRQHVADIVDVFVHAGHDGTAEYVDEEKHHGDRHNCDRDNRIRTSQNMTHGAHEQGAGIAFHLDSLLLLGDCEKDILKGRLLFNVFDFHGREQLFQFFERSVCNDFSAVQDCDFAR